MMTWMQGPPVLVLNNMAGSRKHPRRTFNPEVAGRYGRPTFALEKLVKYSPKYGWARIFNFPFRGSHWQPRMHTIVLSVDGPCKINDSSNPSSEAAWGVYFGPNDSKNICGRVESQHPQTNIRAELEAVKKAIIQVRNMKLDGLFENPFDPCKEVIIRLTSQYVLDTFHQYVWEWEANGWHTTKGKKVAHAQLIQEIHQIIREMEQNMCMGVRFWKTERDHHAQNLAQQAFETDISCFE